MSGNADFLFSSHKQFQGRWRLKPRLWAFRHKVRLRGLDLAAICLSLTLFNRPGAILALAQTDAF